MLGIVTAIVGAVVGAIAATLGSWWKTRRDYKRQTQIERAAMVAELGTELSHNWRELDHPYPSASRVQRTVFQEHKSEIAKLLRPEWDVINDAYEKTDTAVACRDEPMPTQAAQHAVGDALMAMGLAVPMSVQQMLDEVKVSMDALQKEIRASNAQFDQVVEDLKARRAAAQNKMDPRLRHLLIGLEQLVSDGVPADSVMGEARATWPDLSPRIWTLIEKDLRATQEIRAAGVSDGE